VYCSAHCQLGLPSMESDFCHWFPRWHCHAVCSLEGHVCCEYMKLLLWLKTDDPPKVLHGMHHRHLRPWELFSTDDEGASSYDLKTGSFDSFGPHNSYEDEPWVAKYEKRNLIRKVFDREVWIQEPALRQIQDTIFLQAIITAVVITAVIVGVFCAIPKGNRF
jgi:hypothetical protein